MEAYKAQMGNYPSGANATAPAVAGASPNTDSDNGNAPLASTALAAATLPSANAVNAASASSGTAAGDELLTGGTGYAGGTKNTSGSSTLGPWLKDIPSNSGHYAIYATNDGSGDILVLNSAGDVVSSAGATSGAVTYTAADCGGIS
jgi:hypothetical protein